MPASVTTLGMLGTPKFCPSDAMCRYGKFGASMQEIEVAASSAQMHDRIMTFPDGECRAMGIMIFF